MKLSSPLGWVLLIALLAFASGFVLSWKLFGKALRHHRFMVNFFSMCSENDIDFWLDLLEHEMRRRRVPVCNGHDEPPT